MKKINKILFLLITTTAALVSCSKEDIDSKTTDTTTVAASSTIDAANAHDVQTGIEINATNNTTTARTSVAAETCAVITAIQADTYPKVFTVDYGTVGCTIGAITRKGKLKITFTAPIYETGSKMTIERIDYSINGRKLEGTIDYLNITTDATIPQWTRTVTNGKFTDLSGNVFLNSGSYTMKQTGGVGTPFLLADNIYEMIQGKHVVTNAAGETLTLTVLESLVKKNDCEYISKGKLQIEGGLLNGVINYGNNDCDNNYTYTHHNGFIFELKM
ncbi:MAG TPA: hypothetical protein VIV55_02565 [Flavobacterium sp.]